MKLLRRTYWVSTTPLADVATLNTLVLDQQSQSLTKLQLMALRLL
jgi:hypothetical protein